MELKDFERFEQYLAHKRAELAAQIEALGDMSAGGILKHFKEERWIFVLPDVSGGDTWRIQYFDPKGFSGHGLYNNAREAIETAVRLGFETRDDGALDRMQQLPSFWRGGYAAELIRKINGRELTMAEGDALMAQYDKDNAAA